MLTADDVYLFHTGVHTRLYGKLGAHTLPEGGVRFAVWAPNAGYVSVIGDFNDWDKGRHPMRPAGDSGVWTLDVPQAAEGTYYKYHVAAKAGPHHADKLDPFGTMHAVAPRQESIVRKLDYTWNDADWLATRGERQGLDRPLSIYEMHVGSWARSPEDPRGFLSVRDIAPRLIDHIKRCGFTHVELLPIMEHPFYGSWGYQTTGYFAPTSRYGTPQDYMYLIDQLHQAEIGVILDWVPSHFPEDAMGLARFDGTHLFEHADPRQGFHPDWKSAIFNYGRHEVRSFLISSALFWLEKYHVDGIRVDAVASMLYLDYARKHGEWIPNVHGGNENLEAVAFLRQLNDAVHHEYPDVRMIAEESTSWPGVTRSTYAGGLGFDYKWDMGWMNDTLRYFGSDPIYRQYHHTHLTFRGMYQYSEHYVLPLSHDEVVHLKKSLLDRMPGDVWQKFANLRLLLVNQWTQPGKKLLFMGGEIGQWNEWNHEQSVDWHLLDWPSHQGIQRLVSDLNRLYREVPALHEGDGQPFGFEWIDANDAAQSVTTFLRKGRHPDDVVLVAVNHTPVPRHNYRIGVPIGGCWREVLNSDAMEYWGSGQGNLGLLQASPLPHYGWPRSLTLTLPPLGAVLLRPEPGSDCSPS